MSCQNTQKLLDGYLDGELDLVRTMEIEGHLRECPVCSELHASHRALRSAIRAGAPYFKSSAGLQRRVRSAVRKIGKAEPAPRAVSWRPPWSWAGVAAALAVVVLLAWRLLPNVGRPSADELLAQDVLSSHIRSLMASHLTDVPSADQHTVKPWFNGKLDFSPPVGDFTDEGFVLVGGRLDYLADRPVAALVYQRRKHFINLFVWPVAGQPDAPERITTRQGYNVLHWTRSGMTYWVASDLSLRELQEFVRLEQNRAPPQASP